MDVVIKPTKIIIDVPVRDVPRGVGFYCCAFDASIEAPGNFAVCNVRLGPVTLRVFDVALAVRTRAEESRLRFPPIALCRDDRGGFVRRTRRAGGEPIALRVPRDGESCDEYMTVRDPFGHEWTFGFMRPKPG